MNAANIIKARPLRNSLLTRAPERQRRAPIQVFRARCEARAILFAAGALNLQEAVDALQAAAAASGLVDQIGQDRAQQIMSDAFCAVRP